MEDKWVIAYRDGRVAVARSWTGKTMAVARARLGENALYLSRLTIDPESGLDRFGDPVRAFDWLVRSHAFDARLPLPTSAEGAELLSEQPLMASRSMAGNSSARPWTSISANHNPSSAATGTLRRLWPVATPSTPPARNRLRKSVPLHQDRRPELLRVHYSLMSATSVRRGLPVPRSRAKLRGRLDRREPEAQREPAREAVLERCRRWLPSGRGGIEAYEQLDLRDFLRESADLGVESGERLRLLAVAVEEQVGPGNDSKRRWWRVFDRIYQAALSSSSDPATVHHSRAITSLNLVLGLDREDPEYAELWKVAVHAAREGSALAPNDADLLYTLGYVLYMGPSPLVEKADAQAEAFRALSRAIETDPSHDWAKLYIAHILHDSERWSDAAEAYSRVNAASFAGLRAWRYELLREQRAYCLMRAGNMELALSEFNEVIRRREEAFARGEVEWDSNALMEPPLLLAEAASGPLRNELYEKVRALVQHYSVPLLE